jgi:hypothetical protein
MAPNRRASMNRGFGDSSVRSLCLLLKMKMKMKMKMKERCFALRLLVLLLVQIHHHLFQQHLQQMYRLPL